MTSTDDVLGILKSEYSDIYDWSERENYEIKLELDNGIILNIKPEYRRDGLGSELVEYVDGHLKKIGVEIASQSVPSNMEWDGLLVDRGYKKFRTIYEKEL